jgi:hypothetical protein
MQALPDKGLAGNSRDHWPLQNAQLLHAVQNSQIVGMNLFRYPFANARVNGDLSGAYSGLGCRPHSLPQQGNYLAQMEQVARSLPGGHDDQGAIILGHAASHLGVRQSGDIVYASGTTGEGIGRNAGPLRVNRDGDIQVIQDILEGGKEPLTLTPSLWEERLVRGDSAQIDHIAPAPAWPAEREPHGASH